MLDAGYPYVSQAGQDMVVDRVLGGKRGGTFIDVGGYDGTTGSNSWFFELWRGWYGVRWNLCPRNWRRQSWCAAVRAWVWRSPRRRARPSSSK